MKQFKTADFFISVFLIVSYTVAVITDKERDGILNNTLLQAYFVIGGWQSISMIIHAICGWFTRRWSRRHIYHWISFTAVVTMPAGSVWILVFAAPFMALYYAWICYDETFVWLKRPLHQLK